MKWYCLAGSLALVLGSDTVVLAHHEPAAGGGWTAGFSHPWFGLDHLLAMVTVGMLAAKLAGRARWLLPAGFVGGMIAGAGLSWAGVGLPAVEPGIALSVVALGLLLAVTWSPALPAATAIVVAIGALHGHAHGSEMPALAQPALYAAGFVLATVLLHLAGIAAGQVALARAHGVSWRWLGGAVTATGVVLLVNVLG